jgi:hypothetical protein
MTSAEQKMVRTPETTKPDQCLPILLAPGRVVGHNSAVENKGDRP